jgi:hypothetical protein
MKPQCAFTYLRGRKRYPYRKTDDENVPVHDTIFRNSCEQKDLKLNEEYQIDI